MGKYKVIIAGCRDFSNYALLAEKCDYYLHDKIQTHEVIIMDEQPDPSGTRKWLLKLMLSLHFGMAKAVERLT